MPNTKVAEVDYFEFKRHLQEATDRGQRIEPRDRERWTEYVKENHIREVVMKQWAKRFENSELVIIDKGDEWDGYYAFSSHDELVYKWAVTK